MLVPPAAVPGQGPLAGRRHASSVADHGVSCRRRTIAVMIDLVLAALKSQTSERRAVTATV